MANNERLRLLREQLIRRNVRVTNDWLEGCMEYFLENKPDVTNEELLSETFEQYLLADVNDVGLPVIPDSVVRIKGIQTIEGRFNVQMNYAMNVAESAYDLLQQLYKQQIDETDEEQQNRRNNKSTKKQRMLKLELTDGRTKCYGMEYSPIPQLNLNLSPGTKLRLIGPFRCINHVLYLESKNIEVLGGEVDTLLIENAFENMLLKSLNKPINPSPKAEYTGSETTVQNGLSQLSLFNGTNGTNGTIPARTQSTVFIDDPFADNEMFCEVDFDAIAAQRTRPSPIREPIRQTNRYDEYEEDPDDLDALAQIEAEMFANQSTLLQVDQSSRKRPSTSPVPGTSNSFMYCERPTDTDNPVHISKVPKLEISDDLDLDDEFDMMVAAAMDLPKSQPKPILYHSSNYKFRLEGCNLLTFSQLEQIESIHKINLTVMIYGFAKEVTKALAIVQDKWTLELNLEDEPESLLSVSLTPDTLDKMIGVSAGEIKLMRQRAKTQPSLKEEIFSILKSFNDTLKSDRKFWKVKFDDLSMPKVISVTNLKPVYKKVLVNKIESEKLDQLKATVPEN